MRRIILVNIWAALVILTFAGCVMVSNAEGGGDEISPVAAPPDQEVSVEGKEQIAPDPKMLAAPAAGSTNAGYVETVKIYLIALEDKGQSGPKIGCDDSLIAVSRDIAPTQGPLKAALQELLSVREQYYGQSGLYNALYQSDLQLDKVIIDETGKAVIHFSGNYTLGGVCDIPRFEAQIEATARQFATVKDVAVFLNDIPMEEALSLAGN